VYTPPTRASIEAQIIASVEGKIGTSIPILARAVVRVFAVALSGALALLYQVILWAMRQIHPQTADAEFLAYLGERYAMPRRAATTAILAITITGAEDTVVAAGTLWAYGSLVFTQSADVTIIGGTASAQVEALVAGISGNLAPATELALPSPIAGITSAVVASLSVAAIDAETVASYRARIIQRMRNQPQGGATGDYVRWAMEVAGIEFAHATRSGTDVYVYPLAALTGAARIPEAGKIAEVQSYLQDPLRRPLCATVYAQAPTERTVDVSITGVSPADAATKARIEAAFESYIYAAYPKQFSDDPAPTDVISLAAVWALVIASVAVATAVTLTISGIGSGVTTYTLPIGEIAKPGTVTWA